MKMKLDKSIEIPLTIGMVLQGISLIIYLLIIFAQKALIPANITNDLTGIIIPTDFFVQVTVMLLYIIYFFAMITTKSESKNTLCIIMLIFYAVVKIVSPYILVLSNMFAARKGADFLAATGTLTSKSNLIAAPLTTISSILVIVAISRYGVLAFKDEGKKNY